MIAYKASDVQFSWDKDHRHGHAHPHGAPGPKTCGYVKEGEELEEDDDEDDEPQPSPWTEALHQSKKERKKRQIDQYEYTPTKTRCPLLLVADYRFFQEMGGSNTKTTINYLVNMILIRF